MRNKKRKSGVWHHRVPDYKLVYCGREENFPEKELTGNPQKKKSVPTKKYDLT